MTLVNPNAPPVGNPSHEQAMLQEMHNLIVDTRNESHVRHTQIHDTLTAAEAHVDNVWHQHVPSTWENITNLVLSCCRWVGSLFTGRR